MSSGGRRDLAGNAAQTLGDQLTQRPACAVAGEHGKVVNVNVSVAVSVGDLVVIHLAEPIVSGDRARVGQDQTADGISNGRVFLNSPVSLFQIVVNYVLVVKNGVAHISQLFTVAAVQNVCLCNVAVACLAEHGLNAVLNVLNGDQTVFDLRLEICSNLKSEEIDNVGGILFFKGIKRLCNSITDLGKFKLGLLAVAFYYFVHGCPPVFYMMKFFILIL